MNFEGFTVKNTHIYTNFDTPYSRTTQTLFANTETYTDTRDFNKLKPSTFIYKPSKPSTNL